MGALRVTPLAVAFVLMYMDNFKEVALTWEFHGKGVDLEVPGLTITDHAMIFPTQLLRVRVTKRNRQ